MLVGLFFLFSQGPAPGTNEPHYLCKAKSFWDPQFCSGDLFLESADAHYLFYFTLGGLTCFLDLPQAAWAGRLICWLSIAIGWRMLSFSILPRPGYAVFTAGLMVTILHHFHFAGEWLIGGVEAKCIAYGFLFAALSFIARGRWGPVWVLLGCSAAFHVLVGGWGVIAGGFAWLFCTGCRGHWQTHLGSLLTGLAIGLLGLIPALALTMGQDLEVVAQANEIYTFDRLSHHLVFSHIWLNNPVRLDLAGYAAFCWLVSMLLFTHSAELKRVHWFVTGTLMIAVLAIGLEMLTAKLDRPDLAAKLLRYYWFRLADVMIPAGLALSIGALIERLRHRYYDTFAVAITLFSLLVVFQMVWMNYQVWRSGRPQADRLTLTSFENADRYNRKVYRDWVDVCCWIRETTEPEARFLTPRRQSTFKWYAHRSEVVAWKDVPQDASGVVAWKKRFEHVFRFHSDRIGLLSYNAEQRLVDLGKEYQAQYVVVERRHLRNRKQHLDYLIDYIRYFQIKPTGLTAPIAKPLFLKQVFPNKQCTLEVQRDSSYVVYRLEIPPPYQSVVLEIGKLYQE